MANNGFNLMIRRPHQKVGLASVIFCGDLHKEVVVIYSFPGDWVSSMIEWFTTKDAAYAEVIACGYQVCESI